MKLILNREGNDGPWSSFTIEIGTPAQSINVLISTASYQTWGVDPAGCTATDPTTCGSDRGRFYNNSASASWDPNRSDASTTIYVLDLEIRFGVFRQREIWFRQRDTWISRKWGTDTCESDCSKYCDEGVLYGNIRSETASEQFHKFDRFYPELYAEFAS